MSQLLFQIQSTFIVILMTIGILKRKQRKVHIPIMLCCIIWDVILILQIQFLRHAVQKAVQIESNHNMLNIHVSFAVATVILYTFMLVTGRELHKGNLEIRKIHGRFGKLTYCMRILTYATSFFAVI